MSFPIFFIYVKDLQIQDVVIERFNINDDAVKLLGKLDRAKTLSSGSRYRFIEAVKLDFDVQLNDPDDTRGFLEENDEDILREYFKPFNLLQNEPSIFYSLNYDFEPVSSIFFFFQEIHGGSGAKTRIHLDQETCESIQHVEINDVNDFRKTRNYLGIISAVAKKARNRTRHFRGNQ